MVVQSPAKAKRAYGYCRVSTAQQAGERHSSLETQESRIRDYCRANDIERLSLFTDVVSGRRDDRAEYRNMVSSALDGGADVIVAQFLDRLGRNPREILRRIWELQDHGVQVVATDEDIQEELLLLVRAGLAGAESRRNAERVRANMGRAAAKGVHFGRAPYGFKRVKEMVDGEVVVRFEQEPDEALVVREMYRLAVEENLGYKAIADRLTDIGHRARQGRGFATFTTDRILNNEALVGTLTFGKRPKKGGRGTDIVRVPNFFPAILTEEEWGRLEARLAIRRESSRGRTHASQYLLSGIARCGHCGGPMTGKVGMRKKSNPDERYRNYYCSRAREARSRCAFYNGHSAPKLERAILEQLGEYSDPKQVRELLAAKRTKDGRRAEGELKRVTKRLDQLQDSFLKDLALHHRGVLDEREFAQVNESRREERDALEAKRAELSERVEAQRRGEQTAKDLPVQVRSFVEDFDELDVRRQKARLQEILKAAYVSRDGTIELEFRA